MQWRLIVVGGHTRSIGKTQLVCDLIAAFPDANWIAGKITQYGHGVCARNGKCCDCAPNEHICALTWEKKPSHTDSGRFLAAGARRSFWLRTKQGHLAEGIPLLRSALSDCEFELVSGRQNLILESNTLLEFVKPSLYLMVVDVSKPDFKESARRQTSEASAVILRRPMQEGIANGGTRAGWSGIAELLANKPQFLQRENDLLPAELLSRMQVTLSDAESIVL
jgi:hypothetical protein